MSDRRAVQPDSMRRELRAVAPFLVAALVAWGAGLAVSRSAARPGAPELLPWQRSYLELSVSEQRLFRLVREGLLEAENVRSATKAWPTAQSLAGDGVPPFAPEPGSAPLRWTHRSQGLYVNYLGVPEQGAGLRWLVLFIEPEPAAFVTPGEKPPPVDEEHHTLPDGTALHVTVWTQPSEGVVPEAVLAFPVSEGWTQRVGR